MSKRYSIAEARAHLPAIIDAVEAGGPIEVTRRGKPVAVVVSPAEYQALRARQASFAVAYADFSARFPADADADAFADVRSREPGREVEL